MTSLLSHYNSIATLTDLGRHWYRSMTDSVCHAPKIFQLDLKTEILSTETLEINILRTYDCDFVK